MCVFLTEAGWSVNQTIFMTFQYCVCWPLLTVTMGIYGFNPSFSGWFVEYFCPFYVYIVRVGLGLGLGLGMG